MVEENDARGEQFGLERLTACVGANRGRDLASIRKEVFSAIDSFAADQGLRDDMSLIPLRREEEA